MGVKKKRLILRYLLGFAAIGLLTVVGCNILVGQAPQGRIYSQVDAVPFHRVGVVLGTSPTYDGYPNPFFLARMDAAARLYHARRVSRLLVSGDGESGEDRETEAMRDSLVKLGVPETAITMDGSGFRTLDTVVRARKVYGLDDCTFITDDFHMARTLYLADHEGVQAVGFIGKHVPLNESWLTLAREAGARALVVLDVATGRGPRVLGPKQTL